MLENYISQSNGTHKVLQKYKHKKCIKQERHRYIWFTKFGLRPWRNSQHFLYIIQQNEEIQPTTNRCNFIFSLTQSPLFFRS